MKTDRDILNFIHNCQFMFTRQEEYYKLDHIIAGFIDIKQLIIQK